MPCCDPSRFHTFGSRRHPLSTFPHGRSYPFCPAVNQWPLFVAYWFVCIPSAFRPSYTRQRSAPSNAELGKRDCKSAGLSTDTFMLAPAAKSPPAGTGRRPPSTAGPTPAVVRGLSGPRLRRGRSAPARAVRTFAALGLAARASAGPSLPYVPTTILLPPDGRDGGPDMAYIFSPRGDAVDFLALNISSALRASALAPTQLSAGVPFLSPSDGRGGTTFAPSMLPNGTIAVVAGDCSAGSSSLWTYTPGPTSQWTAHAHALAPSAAPYHLGNALAFSAQLSPTISPPTLYLAGGMCPNTTSTPDPSSDWQSSARYAQHMVRLPASPESKSKSKSPPNPQPIPAAGSSLTALPPSLTNLTTALSTESTITQQASHVLLGGHTARAFVNMSTAAVWSLPGETWAFVDIARGGAVESRSGHTAVLSEDGARLVVYGGWVGDVGQRAEPQLAVIGMGVGIGVGAAVLVLLAALAFRFFRRRRRRRAARDETLRSLAQGINGSLPRGLGGENDEMLERDYGVLPWTAASARGWYAGGDDPYLHGQRAAGYESLRGGTRSGPSLYMPPPPAASGAGGRPRAAQGLYQPSTGLGPGNPYDFAPLTRGPNRGIEPIYEADEDEDEDGDVGKSHVLSPDRDDDDPFSTPALGPTPNGSGSGILPVPSISPLSTSNPSPEPQGPRAGQSQDADVQHWVSDVDAAADAALAARRRSQRRPNPITTAATTPPPSRRRSSSKPPTPTTPTAARRPSSAKANNNTTTARSPRHSTATVSALTTTTDTDSARTGSDLSEKSAFSFAPSPTTATADRNNNNNNNNNSASASASSSAHTFNTARSDPSGHGSFAALRAEGPGLLLLQQQQHGSRGGGGEEEDEEAEAEAEAEEEDDEADDNADDEPGSPSKSKPARRSWLGSLRRVFSGAGGAPESSRGRGLLLDDDGVAAGGGSDYEPAAAWMRGGAGQRRRRRRQGREAWFGDAVWGEESEWDVETAVGQRSVQVMFTVPRERLRVVNGGAEVEEEMSAVLVDPDEGDESPAAAAAEAGGSQPDAAGEHAGPEAHGDGGRRDRMSAATLEPPPGGISPSASLRTSSTTTTTTTTTTLHTAEAVRLERPRNRVRNLVESIESRHRDGSPAGVSDFGVFALGAWFFGLVASRGNNAGRRGFGGPAARLLSSGDVAGLSPAHPLLYPASLRLISCHRV
ncbi:hypothetical protein BT67DRAFT_434142 [Trichocladium antarcticum]|uniref:Galactose oxidase n=1 Tax=Trichocladium antarcticum TaxID=1450529 RepID=A0AAN6ZEB6_9PEZI|nr:hypothetical protein BT67DRAFT_434142 [Trichocladium antarcticum]